MKMTAIVFSLFALGACSTPATRPESEWQAYQAQVSHDEQEGKLKPSEAQHLLHDGWVNIHGEDGIMTGFFAYSETLLRSAEQGRLDMAEAKQLVAVRERSAWKEYQDLQRRRQQVAGPDYDRW
jgi:hypothetical protein